MKRSYSSVMYLVSMSTTDIRRYVEINEIDTIFKA